MIALLLMPIVIEFITRGMVFESLIKGVTLTLWGVLAEGEMSALSWVPQIIALIWECGTRPTKLPPEYIPKSNRDRTESWLWKRIPETWIRARSSSGPRAVTRLAGRGTSPEKGFSYQSYSPAAQRRAGRKSNRRLAKSLQLVALTCMAGASIDRTMAFDSDSKQIAIDNCSSRCLTNSAKDLLPGTVRKCNVVVTGVGGKVKCKTKGTVSWTIEDDQGRAHDLIIPDTPVCSALPHRLLSPQHWAQETEKASRIPLRGKLRPKCTTNADTTTLKWGR
jgi:hypothetical protein